MSRYQQLALLLKYITSFTQTKQLLKKWWQQSLLMPLPLQEQAQASLKEKAFHCIGGSIYALYPRVNSHVMLEIIVALQTISDYLDNLCDRMSINEEQAFRQLHLSFKDALNPAASISNYYKYYPYQEEHYLPTLVKHCQRAMTQLPNFQRQQPYLQQLADYYCELQVLKHLQPDGEHKLKQWITTEFNLQTLSWNEWAAATGSTLGIFMLLASCYHPYSLEQLQAIYECYFPWIEALHIQLDYLIDAREDLVHNDLNFTFYYHSKEQAIARIKLLIHESKKRIGKLPYPYFHELVINGLLSLYGSDPKVKDHQVFDFYQPLLKNSTTWLMYQTCVILRKRNVLP